ncbi:SpoIID/LytB domain-containing protein [bacterium]|nr:SpoIID/LytB domain-containing protein [bacterium]
MKRRYKSLFYSLIMSFALPFLFVFPSLALDVSVRVLVYRGKEFSVSGKFLSLYIRNSESQEIKSLSRIIGKLDTVNLVLDIVDNAQNTKRLELDSRTVLEITGSDISLNGITYRGGLRIISRNNSMLVINIVPLEEYLYGVVPSEVPFYWHQEALKAQAVLARTYTIKNIMSSVGRDYDLESTENSQVYRGKSGEYSSTTDAVNSTKGEVIYYGNSIASVYFHSTCGGHTESLKEVWGIEAPPYLNGVECQYCKESPWSEWERKIKREDWDRIIKDSNIELELNSSGRVSKLNGISGTKIRSAFNLPSTFIVGIEVRETEVIIKGKGYGHGVGVCQWGMKRMAELGFSYKEIISYYLPGVTVDAYRGF